MTKKKTSREFTFAIHLCQQDFSKLEYIGKAVKRQGGYKSEDLTSVHKILFIAKTIFELPAFRKGERPTIHSYYALLTNRYKDTASPKTVRVVHAPKIKPPKTDREAFYLSWEWRTLRMKVLQRFGYSCQCCGASKGDTTVGGTPVKIVVDHIHPLYTHWDKRLVEDNLQVLCDECNMGKGAWDTTDHRPVTRQ